VPEARRSGRPASPGFACGPVHVPADVKAGRTPTGDAGRERDELRAAIHAATADIARLAMGSEGEAAEILGFQIAMLDDEALSEGAFHAIEAGVAADRAWTEALTQEIAGYEASPDDYFRGRAADLADIRDRVLAHLTGTAGVETFAPGAIILADDLTPSRFLAADWSKGGGIALRQGSPSSHVAMLARSRGVPMVVGIGEAPAASLAVLDGDAGAVVFDPEAGTVEAFEASAREAEARHLLFRQDLAKPAALADGSRVAVMINVADPAELDNVDPAHCDGIGLVRTEFLFHAQGGLPDEETQLRAYGKIVEWAKGRPVTVRTLDAGGDKPVEGLTSEEANPFLGLRGIRLSLARPAVFRVQLRALARAAASGPLRVMLPMVSVPGELTRAAAILDEEVEMLRSAGVPCGRPALGMMVEVPAAALCAQRFAAAFYSIGSNDLTQYAFAAARDEPAVADLLDAGDPAVLQLIAMTVAAGRERGVEVSLCGDAGAEISLLPKLMATGLRSISVAPVALARVKSALSEIA
jgi:phosphotransferase system enzyme I (PtsI)